jgi:di/tricarboxylate transporter
MSEISQVLTITALAIVLFVWNRIRMDVIGLMVMAALIVSQLLTVREGVSGFANEAMLTVAAMFVLSAALVRTGAVDVLGRRLARWSAGRELRLLVVSLALVIPLSAFMNNTPVMLVMIPVVMGVARDMNVAPSRIFMPLSFASQMGGTLTLIGTSTNLLVAGLVLDLGLERLGLFDITGPALILTLVGVAYLLTVGRWLTPTRTSPDDLVQAYQLREYLSVLHIEPGSPLSGGSLGELRFGSQFGLHVVGIDRGQHRIHAPRAGTILQEGDFLLVEGKIENIAKIEEAVGVRIAAPTDDLPLPVRHGTARRAELYGRAESPAAGAASGDPRTESAAPGPEREREAPKPGGVRLAELLVPPRSRAVGRTILELDLRRRYGVPVLGILRHGESLRSRMREVVLAPSDLLLVEGTSDALKRVHRELGLALLSALDLPTRRRKKLPLAVGIMVAVVLLAAGGVMPILVSALLGMIAVFLTGCITPEEAYGDIDWMVLVLIGSIIPLGIALQNTGAAEWIAHGVLAVTAPMGLHGALAAFFLLTSILTSVLSNNAAATVLTPIAIATGLGLGVSPMPFVLAVLIAASNSFMTPIGYQTNTFILGPGGYRFSDFLRMGAPLNLLIAAAATYVIPLFFPFHP